MLAQAQGRSKKRPRFAVRNAVLCGFSPSVHQEDSLLPATCVSVWMCGIAPASACAPPCGTSPLSLPLLPLLAAGASCCSCCVPAVVAGTRCSRHSFSAASPLLPAALLALALLLPLRALPLLLLPFWLGLGALRSSYSSPLKICCRTLSCSCEQGVEGGGAEGSARAIAGLSKEHESLCQTSSKDSACCMHGSQRQHSRGRTPSHLAQQARLHFVKRLFKPVQLLSGVLWTEQQPGSGAGIGWRSGGGSGRTSSFLSTAGRLHAQPGYLAVPHVHNPARLPTWLYMKRP